MTIENGEHKRKIFHLSGWMDYDNYEKQAIKDFKNYLAREGQDIIYEDALYLRFLYSGGFNIKDCAKRLQMYE
jgi:hypothetical protein